MRGATREACAPHPALRDYRSDPFAVDGVTLYASKLSSKGAEHTAVREFALG